MTFFLEIISTDMRSDDNSSNFVIIWDVIKVGHENLQPLKVDHRKKLSQKEFVIPQNGPRHKKVWEPLV